MKSGWEEGPQLKAACLELGQFLRCFPLSMVLSVRDAQHQTQCDLGLEQEEEEELRSPEMNPPSGRQPAALTDGATAPQTSSS